MTVVHSLLDHCDEGHRQQVPAGTVLLGQGKRTGKLFVLKSGTIEVLRGETRVAAISDAGAVFGEMSLLLDVPHTATVQALTDCDVYLYDDAAAFMRSDPAITFAVAQLLAQRLNAATTYLVDLKQQYANSNNHLGMVSDVLASLINQPSKAYEPGSDREPDHRQ